MLNDDGFNKKKARGEIEMKSVTTHISSIISESVFKRNKIKSVSI